MPRGRAVIRIGLVEDQLLFAEALDIALSLEGFDVHRVPASEYTSSNGHLLTTLLRLRPTLVLLDLDLGGTGEGMRLVAPLSRAGIAVVVITGTTDGARWGECLRHGARTVLPKSSPMNAILATIRHIGAGRPVLTREERDRLVAQFHEEKVALQGLRQRLDQLTAREQEVLSCLRDGMSVAEIARQSTVSEATVRTQVRNILAKLEVNSQLAAVGATHRAQWNPSVLPTRR